MSFAYDYESYANVERGSFYDLEFVFPGPVCRTFHGLGTALETLFEPRSGAEQVLFEWKRRLFFDQVDDCSSARLVARVGELVDFDDFGNRPLAMGA